MTAGSVPFRRVFRRLAQALAIVFVCGIDASAANSVQGWRIDEAHTTIGFRIDATGFPTTRGRFARFTGRVLIDFERPAKSFTSFTVDATSLDVGSASFNDFVRSPALLDVARFPTLGFTSTGIEKLDARTARVSGNLTMLGVTRPIVLTVTVEAEPSGRRHVVAFSATGTAKRSEFGMVFGIPLIEDAFEITVKTRALADE